MTSPSKTKFRWAVLVLDGPQLIEMEPDERGNLYGVTKEAAVQTLIEWHLDKIASLQEIDCSQDDETTD